MKERLKNQDKRLGKAVHNLALESVHENKSTAMTLDLGEYHGRVEILIYPELKRIH